MLRPIKGLGPPLLCALSLLLGLTILFDLWPGLRGPVPDSEVWHWPYQPHFSTRIFWPVGLAASFLAWGWFWLGRSGAGLGHKVALSGLAILTLLLQFTLVFAAEGSILTPLLNRTLALNSGGYFAAAGDIEAIVPFLRDFPKLMPTFVSDHPRTHPPGLILAQWLTIHLLEYGSEPAAALADLAIARRCTDLWLLARSDAVRAALLGWSLLPPIVAALTVWPAYGLLRHYDYRPEVAWAGALMAGAIPALLLFVPGSDQLYPPLVLVVIWLVDKGLRSQRWLWGLPAGLLLSLLTFLSIGNASLGLLLLLYGALLAQAGLVTWRRLIGIGALVASSTLSLWLLNWVFTAVAPWEIIGTALEQHWDLVNRERDYTTWLYFNLQDFLLFAGLPLAAGAGLFAWRASQRRLGPLGHLVVATLITLLLLNFSGSVRGEVGRVWLLFMPLLALGAAVYWHECAGVGWLWPGLSVQLLLALALGLAWTQIQAVILVAEPPADLYHDATSTPLVTFGEIAQLIERPAVESHLAQGKLAVTYRWRSSATTSTAYTVFNHLVAPDGALVAQTDSWSVQGSWPTTCWRVGEVVTDSYVLELPAGLAAGSYSLHTGFYDAGSGQRLTLPNGSDHFLVTTLQIPAQ